MANVLTLPEVADYLRVHPSTIYRLLKQQRIPAFKMGSDWRFNQESIDLWRIGSEADAKPAQIKRTESDSLQRRDK